MSHPHLLAPGRIGSLSLRNRILMCPMGDNQATDGGYVTDQQIDYFEARAKGGAALLLVGSVGVTAPDGLSSPRQSAIGGDDFVDGWRRLADRVHAHDGRPSKVQRMAFLCAGCVGRVAVTFSVTHVDTQTSDPRQKGFWLLAPKGAGPLLRRCCGGERSAMPPTMNFRPSPSKISARTPGTMIFMCPMRFRSSAM